MSDETTYRCDEIKGKAQKRCGKECGLGPHVFNLGGRTDIIVGSHGGPRHDICEKCAKAAVIEFAKTLKKES